MSTLNPGPSGRPTPHPAANSKWGPGAAHLLARRKRAARGGRVPSPGCLASCERPAPNPGGAPGWRALTPGTPGRSPPIPGPYPPQGEQQHHGGAGWTRSVRLRSSGSRRRGPCSGLLLGSASPGWSARCQLGGSQRGQPAPVLPSRQREGPWDAGAARGRDAGRGRESREQVARAAAEAQPSTRGAVALRTAQEPCDKIEGGREARDLGV